MTLAPKLHNQSVTVPTAKDTEDRPIWKAPPGWHPDTRVGPPLEGRGRYPLSLRKRPMTIAAGFTHRDGVLLCCDTKIVQGNYNSYESKLYDFRWDGRSVGFAFAGNKNLAESAIQECDDQIKKSKNKKNFASAVKHILSREYASKVLCHPAKKVSEEWIEYSIIAAIPSDTGCALYAFENGAMSRKQFGWSIGVGAGLAKQLIDAESLGGSTERFVFGKMAYVLKTVKDYVTDCGGLSQFISIRNDGTRGDFTGHAIAACIEQEYSGIDMLARNLFFRQFEPGMTDEHFDKNIEIFTGKVRDIWKRWKQQPKITLDSITPRG